MVSGNVNLCSHYGKHYGITSKIFKKIELPYEPSNSLWFISKNKIKQNRLPKTYLYSHVHCSIIFNGPSFINGHIFRLLPIVYIVNTTHWLLCMKIQYHFSMTKNEILLSATKWIDPEELC